MPLKSFVPAVLPAISLALLPLVVAACSAGGSGGAPGDEDENRPYDGIDAAETLRFAGTEPFWSGEVTGGALQYSTPDNQAGWTVRIDRFAGRNGVSFYGMLQDQPFVMAVSPGQCSDGMSDRVYPFNVTLVIGGETRNGCAWSDTHPFKGDTAP